MATRLTAGLMGSVCRYPDPGLARPTPQTGTGGAAEAANYQLD